MIDSGSSCREKNILVVMGVVCDEEIMKERDEGRAVVSIGFGVIFVEGFTCCE